MTLRVCRTVQDEYLSPRPNLRIWAINGVWMELTPGGRRRCTDERNGIPPYPEYMSSKAIEIDYGFSINNGKWRASGIRKRSAAPHAILLRWALSVLRALSSTAGGLKNFAERSDLMSSLVNGTVGQ
jgi:hypothetical protein